MATITWWRNGLVEGLVQKRRAHDESWSRWDREVDRLSAIDACYYWGSTHEECERVRRQAVYAMAQELLATAHERRRLAEDRLRAAASAAIAGPRTIARIRRERAARRESDVLAAREPGWTLRRLAAKRERLAREARAALAPLILEAYRACGYRQASGTWVGGENTLAVRIGPPRVSADVTTVWHKRHTWKGTNLDVVITVPQDWATTVRDRGLATIEGVLTLAVDALDGADVFEEVYAAAWVEQSRGLSLRLERGVVYRRRSRGATSAWLPWIHAATLTAARSLTSRMVQAARGAA